MLLWGFAYLDLIVSAVIVFVLRKSGLSLPQDSIANFMQTTPVGFDYDELKSAANAISNVTAMGGAHVWSHALNEHQLTCRFAVEIT